MKKSQIVKRTISIPGRKTSISLEDAFWNGLKEIAASRDVPLPYLVEQIERAREHDNLSSAIRLFVLRYYRDQLMRGQPRAGHGTKATWASEKGPCTRGHFFYSTLLTD
jgi:predicted DNA-binding ribbon-helix-helix protein